MTKMISCDKVYSGRVLDVGIEQHEMPDGRVASFEIIRHPGGAAVLPVLADGRILLIRQFRPAIGEMVYEIPAGRIEANESAEECAARELIEEAGYCAGQLELLGTYWSTVGFCDELIHLYLGHNLSAVTQQLEPDEIVELCPLPLSEALRKINNGEILDSKTQLALFHYQVYCRTGDK